MEFHQENGVVDEAARETCLDDRITRKEIIKELKIQMSLAGPLMVVTALQCGIQIVTLMFVGHLNELALSGASMAISFVTVTGMSVLTGLSCAIETLCGQSFGAKQHHMLGIHVQRAMLVQLFVCVLLSAIWANTGIILRTLGQNPAISKEAGVFAMLMIPGMFGNGLLQCIFRFLQCQSIVFPMILISAFTFVMNILMCWVMVFKSNLGFRGAALANSISYWLTTLMLALYVKFSSSCSKTWTGFSKESLSLHGITNYVRLAIPSALMVCLEAWSFEFVVLLSGLLPNPKLEASVLAITLNTAALLYMIIIGLSGAVSTRVSNELGARHPRAARLAAYVVIAIGAAQGTVHAIILITTRKVLGYAFSKEREVARYVTIMMLILAPSHLVDAILCVLSGVVRGCGWQKIAVYVNLGSYYLVGLPVGAVLAFVFHIGGKGFWLGISCAIVLQVITFLVILLRTNWEKEAEKATERVHKSATSVELPSSTSNGLIDAARKF